MCTVRDITVPDFARRDLMKKFAPILYVAIFFIITNPINLLATEVSGVAVDTITFSFSTIAGESYNHAVKDKIFFSSQGMKLEYGAVHGTFTSEPILANIPFSDVGVHWNVRIPMGSEISIEIRTSKNNEVWTQWQKIDIESFPNENEEQQFFGYLIGVNQKDRTHKFIQYRMRLISTKKDGERLSPIFDRIQLTFIDAGVTPKTFLNNIQRAKRNLLSLYSKTATIYPKPLVVSRAEWGCDESLMTWPPEYEPITHNIIHHTDTPNDDTDWAARIRAIYYYHAMPPPYGKGWGDIGYNYLVDPAGVLYEGRYSEDYGNKDVIGAHTYDEVNEISYNDGTMGLAFLGSYGGGTYAGNTTPSQAMLNSAEELLAWKCDQRNIDPLSSGADNDGYVYPFICGHRDLESTICPGNNLYNLLPSIRKNVHSKLVAIRPALAVTDPYYDDIGSILTAMGYDFVEIQDSQLADYDFIKDFDAIFINCSSDCNDNAPAAETSLRQYVQNGGAIYASDWAFIYLETSFPEYIDFPADPYVGVAQYVTATITDPGLTQYLGTDTVDLYYNLPAWVVMSDIGPDTDILLQGSYETYSSSKVLLEKGKRLRTLKSSLASGKASTMTDKPLAVFFRYGDGSVTYTTFHNEAQITDLQQKLLEYLVLKPVTSEIARDLIDQIIQWGGSVVAETIDTISQGDTCTFIYVSSEVQDLMFGLGWPGSTMKLSIYRPDDTLYAQKESSASPIFVEVLNAEAGEWTYKITAMDVTYDNYPFVVEIGSKSPSGPLSITVYPNPCYLNTGQNIKIVNLPLNSKVYIYTISGELVRTLDNASEIITAGSSTTAFWDCKNDLGEEVARGIYIYLATDDAGSKKTGKIAIIK